MLQSQFDTLEEPQDAIVADMTRPVPEIVDMLLDELSKSFP